MKQVPVPDVPNVSLIILITKIYYCYNSLNILSPLYFSCSKSTYFNKSWHIFCLPTYDHRFLAKKSRKSERKSKKNPRMMRSMSRLAPLSEEPINEDEEGSKKKSQTWKKWLRTHFPLQIFTKKSDLRILLSVLGCPLFPLSLNPPSNHNPTSQVSSSSQYIIQHFTAATGCRKLEGVVKNIYATGKVSMAVVDHDQVGLGGGTATGAVGLVASSLLSSNINLSTNSNLQKGCFVMWQMTPNKWLIELAVAGHKIVAGSDGNLAWRHTPWLGVHAAKGGCRPLRRAFQGLDPMAIANIFSQAEYMGEKQIFEVDCFVLKLSANHADLAERSDNTAEMIKHTIFGYFSQRSGLLLYLEDSYLTRIQSPGSLPTYWETTMATKMEDYRPVDGVKIAHSGQSTVVITRFGDNLRLGPAFTRMEEMWTIDDIAFNVQGLSMDCFISPKELQKEYTQENLDWRSPLHL